MILFTKICLAINLVVGFGLVVVIPFIPLPKLFEGLFRLGLWIGGIGLFVQAERNYAFISGKTLMSFDFPLWVAKDLGYWVLLIGLLLHVVSKIRND